MHSMINKKTHLCPVCHMSVEATTILSLFHGMSFHFCSAQCHERFTANPHLYIGGRGIPSPKQRGDSVIRQRVLKLNSVVSDKVAKNIIHELNTMMGIKNVGVAENTIKITYDLMEVTTKQIESRLKKIGSQVSTGFGESLKRAFIHYTEETILDNLEHDSNQHSHH